VARGELTTGSATINRRDKMYTVTISANLSQNGALGNAMSRADELIRKNVALPNGVTYGYSGEAENFNDTISGVVFAILLGLLLIYLVLASLYESLITPFTILLAIPPAFTGAFLALFVTGEMLNMFSMIGMIMLMGLVTKNSILLVDHAMKGVRSGLDRKEAIRQAGVRRLRPILMTTFAMLAGTLPLALGIGEAAKMRQSMGIAIMGGLILSTLLTLIVIPAVFEIIDRFRDATESRIIVRPEKFE
jgi:hydrophobic/amphiphilic exporter-1 (mainly G- bacteria), HAE1 family